MTVSAPTVNQAVASLDGTTIAYRTLGAGDGLLVIGGAWRSGRDYLPLAEALSASFTVHVIDRRGRGDSGPQGPPHTASPARSKTCYQYESEPARGSYLVTPTVV